MPLLAHYASKSRLLSSRTDRLSDRIIYTLRQSDGGATAGCVSRRAHRKLRGEGSANRPTVVVSPTAMRSCKRLGSIDMQGQGAVLRLFTHRIVTGTPSGLQAGMRRQG